MNLFTFSQTHCVIKIAMLSATIYKLKHYIKKKYSVTPGGLYSSGIMSSLLPNDDEEDPTDSVSGFPVMNLGSSDWDPQNDRKINNTNTPPYACILRIKRDMMSIYSEPPPGLFVVPDENDLTLIHALITGSFDTPYEGGFFYFILRCPSEYPIQPPRVKLMTTGGGRVRFNPNLYKTGKVCLSILGTWAGPAWSPAQTLASVLISIQSLMAEKPYHNEPGFEKERFPGDAAKYNDIIQHETIRVAVCGMIENDFRIIIPKALVEMMQKSFIEFYDHYEATCKKKMYLNKQSMQDPFGDRRGVFNYKGLLERLQLIREKLKKKVESTSADNSSTDSND